MEENSVVRKLIEKLMVSLSMALIKHKKIKTTDAKAKELRTFIEPLITFAKKGDVHSRRQVLKSITKKALSANCLMKLGHFFLNVMVVILELLNLVFVIMIVLLSR